VQSAVKNAAASISKTASGVSNKAATVYNKVDTSLGGILPGGVSSKNATNNIATIAKAAGRAIGQAVNTLAPKTNLPVDPQTGFNPNLTIAQAALGGLSKINTGSPSLNQKADWVGQNVLPLLIPVGGAAKLAGEEISVIGKAIPTVAKQAVGEAERIFGNVSRGTINLTERAMQAAKNAPTVVKVGVPVAAVGGGLYAGYTGTTQPSTPVTPKATPGQAVQQPAQKVDVRTQQSLAPTVATSRPTAQVGAAGTANTMTTSGAGSAGQRQPVDLSQFGPPRDYNQQPVTNQQPDENQRAQVQPYQPPDWEAERQNLMDMIDQVSQKNAALAAAWMNQMTAALDEAQNQITQMYQQAGSTLDPATLSALQAIRDEVDQRRRQLMEEMNRRGLLQSGIWLEEENRILNYQMTAEEKLLAERLADYQDKIVNSIMEFAKQRVNIMGSFAENQMSLANSLAGAQISGLQDIAQREQQWNQWWAEQQAAAKQRAIEQQQWQQEQAMKQAQLALEQQKAQQTYQINQQKANQQYQLGMAKIQAALNKTSTNGVTKAIIAEIPKYPDLKSALEAYNRTKQNMIASGVDVAEVLRQIYAYFGS